jgi:rhodanese-related sulfurtransferase
MSTDRRNTGLALALCLLALALACDGGGAPRVDVPVGEAYEEWKSDDPPIFLDTRSESEYQQGHIEGSIHIPHTEVASRIDELRATGESRVIVYCERGGRARVAETALEEAGGFEVRHMDGDMRAWRRNRLPVVRDGG